MRTNSATNGDNQLFVTPGQIRDVNCEDYVSQKDANYMLSPASIEDLSLHENITNPHRGSQCSFNGSATNGADDFASTRSSSTSSLGQQHAASQRKPPSASSTNYSEDLFSPVSIKEDENNSDSKMFLKSVPSGSLKANTQRRGNNLNRNSLLHRKQQYL